VKRCALVIYALVLLEIQGIAQNAPTSPPSATTTDSSATSTPLLDNLLLSKRFRRDALGQETESGNEAEKRDEIETDRDSFTPATTTVGRGLTILESAYTFTNTRSANEGHSFPELLVRYGFTERLELRLGWNYEVSGLPLGFEDLDLLSAGNQLERASTLSYGLKYKVTDGKEWMPDSALILAGFTPTSGPSTDTQLVATYVFGWELPNRWKLDAAFRYATASEEQDHYHEWAPSVVLKIPVGERINFHAEYFGFFSTGKAEEHTRHYFSPGVHYLVTENLEIGVRVGWGLNDQSEPFFANLGFGWRF